MSETHNIIENFELCDTPKWFLYTIIPICSLVLILLLYFIFKGTGKEGKKKGKK